MHSKNQLQDFLNGCQQPLDCSKNWKIIVTCLKKIYWHFVSFIMNIDASCCFTEKKFCQADFLFN